MRHLVFHFLRHFTRKMERTSRRRNLLILFRRNNIHTPRMERNKQVTVRKFQIFIQENKILPREVNE